jgi:hypothetical protein
MNAIQAVVPTDASNFGVLVKMLFQIKKGNASK